MLRTHIAQMWLSKWTNYSTRYKNTSPAIPSQPWSHNLNLSQKLIFCSISRVILYSLPVLLNVLLMALLSALSVPPNPFSASPTSCSNALPLKGQRENLSTSLKMHNVRFNSQSIHILLFIPPFPFSRSLAL